jgi:hemerythrin-like domain-containing protein
MERTGKVNTAAVAAIVDFFRTYGDEVHHGKEEKIYFQELAKKKIPAAERSLMEELIREHGQARGIIRELAGALDRYEKGDQAARKDIENALGKLPGLYREHIRKEDRVLFRPSLEAFSPAEQQELLQRMREYDGKMIHDKYRREVEALRVKYP